MIYKKQDYGIQLFILLAFYLLILIDTANYEVVDSGKKGEVFVEHKKNEIKLTVDSKKVYEKARIAMMTSDYLRAEELFLKLIKENQDDWDSIYQLGVTYYKMNRKNEAEKWLKKYLKQKEHKKWLIDAERILGELKNDFKSSQRV